MTIETLFPLHTQTSSPPSDPMNLQHYFTLGNSGLRVSRLALGTMTFGTDWGWGADKETARRLFDT